ncbi:hypothetical protein [Pedobacter sp. SYSU D00535]|uniref:hypothetical protein n=1 Tax=Pedobacter sp. SYSU D00535 TaxID=2810308 RepID=UPI001A965847|nr:hypothetical protein [Pedobacter sp. SYSU D00535]
MKLTFLTLALATILTSCNDVITQEQCENMMCTQQFAAVTVQFKNQSGDLVQVEDFSAVIRRTEKPTSAVAHKSSFPDNFYPIATDADKNILRTEGDIIDVSARHPLTKQTKTAEFVITGGKCTCHIAKKSGPEVIIFD